MLTQQELIEKLKGMGAAVTSQTLRTREKQGLVTPAYRGKSGKPGRSVFYPDRCLYEHYAAGKMLSSSRLRLTAEQVKDAKDEFMRFIENPTADFLDRPEEERLYFRLGEHWFAWYVYSMMQEGKGPFAARVRFAVDPNDWVHDIFFHTVFISTDRNVASMPDHSIVFAVKDIAFIKEEFLSNGSLRTLLGAESFKFPQTELVLIDAGDEENATEQL